jgi:SMP-30/Gluconolactonase/LRE-like region
VAFVTRADLAFIGRDLARPECVVVTARGDVFASDRRGGIARVHADRAPELILVKKGQGGVAEFLPNGFALLPHRSFMIANLGPAGGVYRMLPDGELAPALLEVDGMALPPTNFVNAEHGSGALRLWVSVSTRKVPREQAMRADVADGYIVLQDARGARIVADGLGFTNENKLDPSGQWLYVNETMARRLSRFAVTDDGLGRRETVAEFADGIFPDGFEFDAEGGIWIASVVSNRLLRIAPDGSRTVVLDDGDPEVIARVERNFAEHRLSRADIDAGREGVLGNLASVTFGGPDLKTVYLGSLFADRIATFRSPIAGARPPHWDY